MLPHPPDRGRREPNKHAKLLLTGKFKPANVSIVPLETEGRYRLTSPEYAGIILGPEAKFIGQSDLNAIEAGQQSHEIMPGEFVFFPVDGPVGLAFEGTGNSGIVTASLSPSDSDHKLVVATDLDQRVLAYKDAPITVRRSGLQTGIRERAGRRAEPLAVLACLPYSLQKFHLTDHPTRQFPQGLSTVDIELTRDGGVIFPSKPGQKARPVTMALMGNNGRGLIHLRPGTAR